MTLRTPLTQENKVEWLQITLGERFRISFEETKGVYATPEVAADHRNGVRMHSDQNQDEHFFILEGTAHVACWERTWDAAAGKSFTAGAFPMPGAICLSFVFAGWWLFRRDTSRDYFERSPREGISTRPFRKLRCPGCRLDVGFRPLFFQLAPFLRNGRAATAKSAQRLWFSTKCTHARESFLPSQFKEEQHG
jgi:hypothetical protein